MERSGGRVRFGLAGSGTIARTRLEVPAERPELELVFTAHHFAFSPEVEWAAARPAAHPEWGPVTGITSAFHDPHVLKGERRSRRTLGVGGLRPSTS